MYIKIVDNCLSHVITKVFKRDGVFVYPYLFCGKDVLNLNFLCYYISYATYFTRKSRLRIWLYSFSCLIRRKPNALKVEALIQLETYRQVGLELINAHFKSKK